jgi:hypothetical protein
MSDGVFFDSHAWLFFLQFILVIKSLSKDLASARIVSTLVLKIKLL